MSGWVALSVDLEPNKDGSLDGIADAMSWFDDTVPRGTVYVTHRIASELPRVVESLNEDHEIGIHVHPREFGHQHDQLALLSSERQRELIFRTCRAVSSVNGVEASDLAAFRAGRHSAGPETLSALVELGFDVDASSNINYRTYIDEDIYGLQEPALVRDGFLEIPTTYNRVPILSRVGFRELPNRTVTATAHTLRTDRRGVSGLYTTSWISDTVDQFSFYLHPYDATDYHDSLPNAGTEFRQRFERVLARLEGKYLSASDVHERYTA